MSRHGTGSSVVGGLLTFIVLATVPSDLNTSAHDWLQFQRKKVACCHFSINQHPLSSLYTVVSFLLTLCAMHDNVKEHLSNPLKVTG